MLIAGLAVITSLTFSVGERATAGLWQSQDGSAGGDAHLVVIFLGIIAFGMLMHGLLILGLGIGALMAKKAISAEIADLKAKAQPILNKSQSLIDEVTQITADLKPKIAQVTADLQPKIADMSTKIDAITGHVEELSVLVKDKLAEFGPTITAVNATLAGANQTVMDANAKTHEQLLRLNEMVTNTLDATAQMGKAVRHGITMPGREVAGIVSGVKAAVQTLMDGRPKPRAAKPYSSSVTPFPAAASRSARDDFDE